MSTLSVNALESPSARLLKSRSGPVSSVAIEEQHPLAKNFPSLA